MRRWSTERGHLCGHLRQSGNGHHGKRRRRVRLFGRHCLIWTTILLLCWYSRCLHKNWPLFGVDQSEFGSLILIKNSYLQNWNSICSINPLL
uniref:LD47115p n=1 Tax=Drosophila melanogaster TaxID=7227 RepID=Q95SX5_DROME|nr:LD47115p [Drosophila melanogaster]